jgi:mRNA-degrading endonuclease YafQ of YafQ-DinJ toxin-antitoxin module
VNSYRFKAAPKYWRNFKKLTASQKQSVQAAWQIFKRDPFDPRLRTHKIHRLSAALGKTVYAVEVERDLRVVFYLEGDTAFTLDIGTHDIYRS